MVSSMIFDAFLSIADKVIELLKLEDKKRERMFEEGIKPFFNDMNLVAGNYLTIFSTAEKRLQDNLSSSELQRVINDICDLHQDFFVLRTKTEEMAKLLKEKYKNQQMILDFADSILKFFYGSQINPKIRSASRGSQLIDLFELLKSEELDQQEIRVNIHETRRSLEEDWTLVTRSYAVLSLNYLEEGKVKNAPKKVAN